LLLWHQPTERAKIMEALKELGRMDDSYMLLGEHLVTAGVGKPAKTSRYGNPKTSRSAGTKKAR